MKIDRILSQVSFTKTSFTGFYPPHVIPPKPVPTQEPDFNKLDEELKCYKQPVKDEFIKKGRD